MLLLASASPARRRLLEQAGIPHRVRVSGVDEGTIRVADPSQLVLRLAQAKALAVLDGEAADAAGLKAAQLPTPLAVLGCDSLLIFEGELFGKPGDAAEAITRWERMAGGSGTLLTGHCLLRRAQPPLLETVSTQLGFAPLDRGEIEAYVASGEPLACAGGFALEGRGGLVIERLDGCYSNVIGLSLPLLRRWLAPLR